MSWLAVTFRTQEINSLSQADNDSKGDKGNMKTRNIAHQEKAVHLPAQKISIALPYDRPSTNTYRRLVNFKLGHRIEDMITKRFRIKKNHMEWINWTAIKRAYRGYGKYKRYKVTIPTMAHNANCKEKWISNISQMSDLWRERRNMNACSSM